MEKDVVKGNEKFFNLLERICMDLNINNYDAIIKDYLKRLNQEKLM